MKGFTRLKKAINRVETEIEVNDRSSLPSDGNYIEIDGDNVAREAMRIVSSKENRMEVERGVGGSSASMHGKDSVIHNFDNLTSIPGVGMLKIKNICLDPETGKVVIEYEKGEWY